MITKTYQAIGYQTYDMYVKIDGKITLISFRGGSLRPAINGTFQTSDPKLQGILANDSAKNITFKEIGTFDDEAEKEEATGELLNVEGVITVQGAREYLLANVPGATQASLPNKTAVLALAEANKIVFIDLK